MTKAELLKKSLLAAPPLVGNPPTCNAESPASWDGRGACRCGVCGRCGRHTGNSNQGHYWAACSVTNTTRDFHFCCPGACELQMAEEAR